MMLTMPLVYDEIRKAIANSNKSRYRLWQETGISQGHLSEFMAGTKGLSVEALEKLAECLGLEIVIHPKKNNRDKTRAPLKAARRVH